MARKVLIIGGVAGGASAAARLRRLDETADIIIFEKGGYISFANCGLPYYIGDVIREKDKLVVVTPELLKKRFNIDVRTNSEVLGIDTENKLLRIRENQSGKLYGEKYDKLVLSPGADPIIPRLPGIDSNRIFTLRNIPDTYKIKEFTDTNRPKRAVIVGAGFIGLEVAENLHRLGIKVTIVELADHVIGPLDFEMAAIVHQHLKTKDVELYLKDGVKAFSEAASFISVELASGRTIKADMVILGIGVRPETRIAAEAGLKLGPTGGILTDEYMRTSNPDIYAVGDAVEVRDFITGSPALIPLAGPANKQGRIVASNICGIPEKYEGTQGTSIVKVFNITVATTGDNERILTRNSIDYEKSYTHSPSHAGYYPGAIPMSIKLVFAKDGGKILGAQIVGYDGADKRIDVIATAIRAGMTVHDLEKLELAYAPPFSSAKDPVNIAGYTASNILKGDVSVFHWHDVKTINKENSVLVDVRTPVEYQMGTIEGALNIPLDEIRGRLGELPKDKEILIFCQVGLRGYIASRILLQSGYNRVKNLSGGYKTYQLAVQKQSNEDIYEYDKIMKNDEIKPADCGEDCSGNVEVNVNACGLQCPGPIMKVFEAIKAMNYGESLKATSTDPGFPEDIKSWCERTGNKLVSTSFGNNIFSAVIRKEIPGKGNGSYAKNDAKTLVIFSNDLDRALASFVIANGAAAMGREVTMFFTFWGLNILRKSGNVKVKKDMFGRMFGFMMPKGSKRLKLSKMNMAGIGPRMIRFLMKKKGIDSLEDLMRQAQANGVKMIACGMSMDIMGIKKEELLDGVEIGGVASMLGSAEQSDMSMMI